MADNIISQYYTKNDGSQIGNDAQLINGVYQNEKIVNKNSGEKFVKSQTYRNVFDKVDEKISKIDDANANGVCSCKNASGVEVDTFKCHVPVSNSAPTLKWGESNTIGTVDEKPLTVVLPNTILNYNNATNPDDTYIMTLDVSQTGCHPSKLTISSLLELINSSSGPSGPSGPSFGASTLLYSFAGSLTQGEYVSGSRLYRNPGDKDHAPSGGVGGTWRIDSGLTFHHNYIEKTGETSSGQPYYDDRPVYAFYASQLLG